MHRKTAPELAAQFQGLYQHWLKTNFADLNAQRENDILAGCANTEANLLKPDDETREGVRDYLKELSGAEKTEIFRRRKTHAQFLESYDDNYASETVKLLELLEQRNNFFKENSHIALEAGMDFPKILDSKTKSILNAAQTDLKFLARGTRGEVFQNESSDYVIKVPFSYQDDAKSAKYFFEELDCLVKGQDLACINRIKAYSVKDKAIITDYVDGNNLRELKLDDLKSITEKQLQDLVDTVSTMHERGFDLDLNPENLIYRPNQGFTLIDYGLEPSRSSEMNLLFLLFTLMYQGVTASKYQKDTVESSNFMKEKIRVMKNVFDIITCKRPGLIDELKKQIVANKESWDIHGVPYFEGNLKTVCETPWANKRVLKDKYPELATEIDELGKLTQGLVITEN